jgi:hypothetical protein
LYDCGEIIFARFTPFTLTSENYKIINRLITPVKIVAYRVKVSAGEHSFTLSTVKLPNAGVFNVSFFNIADLRLTLMYTLVS